MFNLVKYRYIFLGVSLLVIIPGFISLVLFQLNLSTDFVGGSNIELRPQRALTDVQVEEMLKPLNLQSLQVTIGDNPQLPAKNTVWIRLNTQIDTTVQTAIKNDLQTKYADSSLAVDAKTIPQPNGQDFTLLTVSGFKSAPQVSDVQKVLSDLPKTTPVTSSSATATPTPTAQATAAATPKATAAATPKATAAATPQATTTATAKAAPTATATPTASNAGTIPVKVEDVQIGTTTSTISILTRTNVGSSINAAAGSKGETDIAHIEEAILKSGGPYVSELNSSQVGGVVAADTTRSSILAVIAASVLILLYVWFSFRKVPKAFRYAACAIIALLHDVLVVLGVFSILGHFFGIQIDALFITALLTVVGFSVHDTIVVFDRIRENMQRRTVETFDEVVNASLIQTMARSLNTSLTVLFTLLALTLFTGSVSASVHTFTLTLLIGIFSGTYSSIFNASMLLVIWEKGELGTWRLSRDGQPPAARRAREVRELAGSRS